MEHPEPLGDSRGWAERLVGAIERAAEAGWSQTARMIALLAVAAAAVALVVTTTR